MDITRSPAGKVIKTLKGYYTYIPNQLPPKIEWSNEVILALSKADYLLGKLAREGSKLANPHLLMRPFVAREAVLSSKIEGTQITIGEVLAYESGVNNSQTNPDLEEVTNYITALNYGLEQLNKLPLSLRLIKGIHYQLMKGSRGIRATPGEFRTTQNWIGAPGSNINNAKFIPPSPEYLMNCLRDLENFMHYKQLPPLIHGAIFHYQFEAIHPFLDGNGRVGRLLIIILLIQQNVIPSPLLYISAFFEATRNEYYNLLYKVSAYGSWDEWLIYFLNGVALQSEDVLSRAERINDLLDKWKTIILADSSKVTLKILENFVINPYLTINKIAEKLNVSYSTAQRSIQRLEKASIIKQINASIRDKVYCATQILNILEEPVKITTDIQ